MEMVESKEALHSKESEVGSGIPEVKDLNQILLTSTMHVYELVKLLEKRGHTAQCAGVIAGFLLDCSVNAISARMALVDAFLSEFKCIRRLRGVSLETFPFDYENYEYMLMGDLPVKHRKGVSYNRLKIATTVIDQLKVEGIPISKQTVTLPLLSQIVDEQKLDASESSIMDTFNAGLAYIWGHKRASRQMGRRYSGESKRFGVVPEREGAILSEAVNLILRVESGQTVILWHSNRQNYVKVEQFEQRFITVPKDDLMDLTKGLYNGREYYYSAEAAPEDSPEEVEKGSSRLVVKLNNYRVDGVQVESEDRPLSPFNPSPQKVRGQVETVTDAHGKRYIGFRRDIPKGRNPSPQGGAYEQRYRSSRTTVRYGGGGRMSKGAENRARAVASMMKQNEGSMGDKTPIVAFPTSSGAINGATGSPTTGFSPTPEKPSQPSLAASSISALSDSGSPSLASEGSPSTRLATSEALSQFVDRIQELVRGQEESKLIIEDLQSRLESTLSFVDTLQVENEVLKREKKKVDEELTRFMDLMNSLGITL